MSETPKHSVLSVGKVNPDLFRKRKKSNKKVVDTKGISRTELRSIEMNARGKWRQGKCSS